MQNYCPKCWDRGIDGRDDILELDRFIESSLTVLVAACALIALVFPIVNIYQVLLSRNQTHEK